MWQHAFLSTSIVFYNIFAQACAEIKILRKWPYIFFLFLTCFGSSFLPVLIFLQQWLTFHWACFLFKNFRESIIKTGNFCHRVAICSGRKLRTGFFTQIFEHFLHILGSIEPITLILVSLERSFPTAELEYRWCLFLVKGDNVRSGTKNNACHGRSRVARESMS